MSSKRHLKKLVNAVCFDIIDELLTIRELHNLSDDKIRDLLNDAINFRNDCITRINVSRKSDDKSAVMKKVSQDLDEKMLEFIDRINALV